MFRGAANVVHMGVGGLVSLVWVVWVASEDASGGQGTASPAPRNGVWVGLVMVCACCCVLWRRALCFGAQPTSPIRGAGALVPAGCRAAPCPPEAFLPALVFQKNVAFTRVQGSALPAGGISTCSLSAFHNIFVV